MGKARGKYRRADIVYHVKHLKDRPDLALSIWNEGRRQLISVRKCFATEEIYVDTEQWRNI